MFWTRNKDLCDKLDVQRNTSRLIEGNDTPFENWLKTLNFPTLYLRKDSLVLLQLLKFVKSDFAANLEDYMSFNKRVIRQGAIVTKTLWDIYGNFSANSKTNSRFTPQERSLNGAEKVTNGFDWAIQ